jgi:hypothetical protein
MPVSKETLLELIRKMNERKRYAPVDYDSGYSGYNDNTRGFADYDDTSYQNAYAQAASNMASDRQKSNLNNPAMNVLSGLTEGFANAMDAKARGEHTRAGINRSAQNAIREKELIEIMQSGEDVLPQHYAELAKINPTAFEYFINKEKRLQDAQQREEDILRSRQDKLQERDWQTGRDERGYKAHAEAAMLAAQIAQEQQERIANRQAANAELEHFRKILNPADFQKFRETYEVDPLRALQSVEGSVTKANMFSSGAAKLNMQKLNKAFNRSPDDYRDKLANFIRNRKK